MRRLSIELLMCLLFGHAAMGCTSNDRGNVARRDSGTAQPDDECGVCDDGFSCTLDNCSSGTCTHTIGPSTGTTACPVGQYCTLSAGCLSAPACSTDAQCVEYWADDACKFNIACEPASSVCTFTILDKDGDGYAPPVCGGGDCNDADRKIHPGAPEQCNGMDDDCNGDVDDEDEEADAGASLCGALAECTNGQCACKSEYLCHGICTDTRLTEDHSGACDHSCGTSPGASAGWGTWSCSSGLCTCPADTCGTVCTSLQADDDNCGECGHACTSTERCQRGTCTPVHVCTRHDGVCESDKFYRTTHSSSISGGIGVSCQTSMCNCPDYTYSCEEVSEWEYECYPP